MLPPLFRKRQIYFPTLLGWLVLLLFISAPLLLLLRQLGGFLSEQSPVGSGALVIEGWVDRAGFANAVKLYREKHYALLLTTGGPYFLDCERDDPLYRDQVAKLAAANGLKPGELVVIRVPDAPVDRTFRAGIERRRWLQSQTPLLTHVDVLSEGPHARRTRILYERALGDAYVVGIIAAAPAYDLQHWWRSSEGARHVMSEAFAWAWVACCYRPEEGL